MLEPQAQLIYQVINFNDFNDFYDKLQQGGKLAHSHVGLRLARGWDLEEAQGDGQASVPGPKCTKRRCALGGGTAGTEDLEEPTIEFSSARSFITPSAADL